MRLSALLFLSVSLFGQISRPVATSGGSVTAVSCGTVPSWLTCSIVNGTSTPTISLANGTGQTPYLTLVTDGSGNVGFSALTTAHLPSIPSTQITGLAASATIDATNASNISSGTVSSSVLPSTSVETNKSNTFTTGTQDLSGATHTLPALKGLAASKPSTCTQGEQYFATDATAGQNLYFCTATNIWTQQKIGVSPTLSTASWNYVGSGGANQVVQSVSNVCAAGSCSATLPSNVTAGHLLVVSLSSFGVNTPTDTVSDTFTLAAAQDNGVNQRLWYTCNAVGGSTTVTMSGGSRAVHVHILEVSGNPTSSCLDQNAAAAVTGTNLTVTSPSVTQSSELVVGTFESNSGSCTSISASTGTLAMQSTLSTGSASGNWPMMTSVYNSNTGLSGAITMAATCNATTSNATELLATFKLTFPAGAGTPPAFDLSLASVFEITLTGPVNGSAWSNQMPGQQVSVVLCQDATGGRSFLWPTATKGGMTIGTTASKCNAQSFVSDGTNLIATSVGVVNQ